MKRAWLILIGGLLAGTLACGTLYFARTADHREWQASQTPELLWLKKEFQLSDAEFTQVSQLHAGYLPMCRERCDQMARVTEELKKQLANTNTLTTETQALLDRRAAMMAECQGEMLKHFYAVSRVMPAEQGRRYLEWVQAQTCLREPMMGAHEQPAEGRHGKP
ncbi:MAG: hypothetical protein AB1705_05350 [Verrucomicrobiota bacterium]